MDVAPRCLEWHCERFCLLWVCFSDCRQNPARMISGSISLLRSGRVTKRSRLLNARLGRGWTLWCFSDMGLKQPSASPQALHTVIRMPSTGTEIACRKDESKRQWILPGSRMRHRRFHLPPAFWSAGNRPRRSARRLRGLRNSGNARLSPFKRQRRGSRQTGTSSL